MLETDEGRHLTLSDFTFALPAHLIAQFPSPQRGGSKLLVVDRSTASISHHRFGDIVDFIPTCDLLVRNSTRVMRARLIGVRDSGAPAEILLLEQQGEDSSKDSPIYEAMVNPGSKLKAGRRVTISPQLSVEIISITDSGTRLVRLLTDLPVREAIEKYGNIPLPPYILKEREQNRGSEQTADCAFDDAERYQTIYATAAGSVAAPTAGLHFNSQILNDLWQKGVGTTDILLHVGAGTFKPVETERLSDHRMHSERFEITTEAASQLNTAKANGNQIWAVGTTTLRTLESCARDAQLSGAPHLFGPVRGETSIFIYPPYKFAAVDHLLTNFHLPKSSLLMLVSAFTGYDLIMEAYQKAIENSYRFYSYGDAMLII